MSDNKKIKVIEGGWPRYKLTISVTPIDKEVGGTKIVKEEFLFRAGEVHQRFYNAILTLKSKFKSNNCKVWVMGSTDKNHFGYIAKQHVDWMGYEVFFPNGLGDRKDPHYVSFRQEFLTTSFEVASGYAKHEANGMSMLDYIKLIKHHETCLIGDVEPYTGTSKLHWEIIAFDSPEVLND